MRTGRFFGYLLWICGSAWSQQALPTDETKVHDPVMIRENGTYYVFCTGPGISVFSSKDMKMWKPEKPVFDQAPSWTVEVVPDFRNHIWAPDISFHDGRYYLYYSVSAFGKNTSAIGVATNRTLDPASKEFKWTDHGIVIRSVPDRDLWNAIDPNLVVDEKGIAWLTFGSFWDGLKMVRLDASRTRITAPEEWHTMARRHRDFELGDADPGNAALEAPFVFKKGEWYYYFLSWDYCCRGEKSTYKVVVGRAKEAKGPYLDKEGKPLFQGGGSLVIEGNANWAGVGHNSAYTFDGKDYIVFHAYDISDKGKPKLKIREMQWQDGWPVVEPMN